MEIAAVLAPAAIIAIAGVGTALRRRRRSRMTLEQRRAQELVPSYRDRIK
jgi:hypothetical protein